MDTRQIIPVFFACDENFVKFMMVTIRSMMDNASKGNEYRLYVLNTGISEERQQRVQDLVAKRDDFSVEFVDVTPYLTELKSKLPLRDYYSMTTYYRLFIPDLYPEYDKIIYLDSDVVVLGDIAEFYSYDLQGCYVGAIPDQLVGQLDVFGRYVEQVLGVDRTLYFNAGVLIMNCQSLRDTGFLNRFVELVNTYTFIVAQDQDYLNVICKNKIKWLPVCWNLEASSEMEVPEEEINLIHFNMAAKPWKYADCALGEYFWRYAERVSVIDEIRAVRENLTEEEMEVDEETSRQLFQICEEEIVKEDNYLNIRKRTGEKSQERLDVMERIAQLERAGKFDVDVEQDPPGKELKPEDINYLPRRTYSKLKTRIAYYLARKFMNHMIAEKQLIVKEIRGIENFSNLQSGAVITMNHFNALDSFAAQIVYEASGHRKRKFYRVIKEGNYTSFPGFYGVLMRNCNTLPLSSNKETMKKFLAAVDKVLRGGHFVLVYPEQSMWWNYRKPKPLKRGAFNFAVKSNVPVLPIFITMEDSDVLDGDGFPVQEYTIHVGEPIYPQEGLGNRENSIRMLEENERVWKEIYEDFYGIPLEYSTVK
ncbi:MAG: glycosyltransferase [Lachnospiraceae bacterium]|nr:glycosyltransferase [Lachnospiraceae bacterium]